MKNSSNSILPLVHLLLPGSRIIKLKGYTNGNKDYSIAKQPITSWKNSKPMSEDEIQQWLDKGGWIGAVVPRCRYIVDIDNKSDGELLENLLIGEKINHHCIETPNGFQFIFNAETNATNQQGQFANFINRLGLVQDSRSAEKGYIVFPNQNTPGRQILKVAEDKPDELPQFLYKVCSGQKSSPPVNYPYKNSGSRNNDFFRLAIATLKKNVKVEDVLTNLGLAHKYFVLYKKDFTIQEVERTVHSAFKIVSNVKIEQRNTHFLEGECSEVTAEKDQLFPEPFSVRRGSLYYGDNQICRSVPLLEKEINRLGTGEVFYELSWEDRGKKKKIVVPAQVISTKRELLKLSKHGLGVHENNATKLICFFDSFLSQTQLEVAESVERVGNVNGFFVHPLLSNIPEIYPNDKGEEQLLGSFEARGTSVEWYENVFYLLKEYPKAVFFIISSFASPILEDLKIDPFIVDLFGTTSQGKTTLLRVATSVWGTRGLIGEWNATAVSIERRAAFLNNFPIFLDDTRKADSSIIGSVVYQHSGGRSKGRASLSGSQIECSWHNILLSTGEVAITEYAKNHGGVAARVIPLSDVHFASNKELLTKIYDSIEKFYGQVGVDFMVYWLANKEKLIPQFQELRKAYSLKANGHDVLSRIAGYYAVIHFVMDLLIQRFDLDYDTTLFEKLFDEIAIENQGIDKPMQFLKEILTHLDSNKHLISYHRCGGTVDKKYHGLQAIYKDSTLYILPQFVSDFLGVEEKATRYEWLKRGITVRQKKRNGKECDYKQVKHNGQNSQAIALAKEWVQNLDFDFSEHP